MITKPPVGWDAETPEQRLARQTLAAAKTAAETAPRVVKSGARGVGSLLIMFQSGLWVLAALAMMVGGLTEGSPGAVLVGALIALPGIWIFKQGRKGLRHARDDLAGVDEGAATPPPLVGLISTLRGAAPLAASPAPSPPPAALPDTAPSAFDADAVMARYLAEREHLLEAEREARIAAAAAAAPAAFGRKTFGRKVA